MNKNRGPFCIGTVKNENGSLAQLVERLHGMQEVKGSSPLSIHKTRVISSVGRAPDLQSGGQGFEPLIDP